MRVGASFSPTSEKRNSMSRALPFETTLMRQFRKSPVSLESCGKLLSTCQPASPGSSGDGKRIGNVPRSLRARHRSEEHTSELQSRLHLVCRLLLEKKKHTRNSYH